jgi:diguanylate cyclase (GGDEF)-like protein
MSMGRVLGSLSIRQRPASAWALALLLAGGGVRCLFGPGAHVAAHTPSAVVAAVGTASVLLAGFVYVVGERCPRAGIAVLLAATTAVTSVLVATATNRADVALSALAYPWAALYAAHFLSRRSAYAVVVLIAGGFGAGILASGLSGLLGAWVLEIATVCAVTAVTESLVNALRKQSETDPLTRIANRAGFQRVADQLLASAARRGEPVALVLCDIDGLKQVNDAGGHAAGDAVLTGVVREWLAVLRSNDVIARLGGDEFAVLMPDTDLDGAHASVERLRTATSSAFSAGVSTWAPGSTLDVLLADADAEMYACKPANGRSHGVVPAPRQPVGVRPAPLLAE